MAGVVRRKLAINLSVLQLADSKVRSPYFLCWWSKWTCLVKLSALKARPYKTCWMKIHFVSLPKLKNGTMSNQQSFKLIIYIWICNNPQRRVAFDISFVKTNISLQNNPNNAVKINSGHHSLQCSTLLEASQIHRCHQTNRIIVAHYFIRRI